MAATPSEGDGWWQAVDIYCERVSHPDFWGEPLNALTNLAFLFAAVMAYTDFRHAGPERGARTILFLILWMMVVGAGSFLFHTFATRWAAMADVVPIAIFVFAYLAVAVHWFVGLGPFWAVQIALTVAAASQVMPPWFNGSFAYAPALGAMIAIAAVLQARAHAAARLIVAAACVFLVSLTARTLDGGAGCLFFPAGAETPVFALGTHALWHILNSVTLYLLVRAAIENPPAAQPGASVTQAPRASDA